MRNKYLRKVLAGVFTMAMAFSVVPATTSLGTEVSEPVMRLAADETPVAAADATTGSAVTSDPTVTSGSAAEIPADLSTIQKILKENRESLLNLPDKKQARIDIKTVQQGAALAETYAGAYAKSKGLSSIKFNVLDKADPVILTTLGKKQLDVFYVDRNVVHEPVPATVTVKKVKVVKKDKKRIIVLQKKGKNTTYIIFKIKPGKLKKVATYSKTGKKCKKNNKSISKKKFNKFVKKFDKLKKLPMKSVSAMEPYFYDERGSYFYKKDDYMFSLDDSTIRLVHEPTDKEDEYKIYEEDQKEDGGTYVFRYILAPNVAPAGSSVTYQQAMWKKTFSTYFDFSESSSSIHFWYDIEAGKYPIKSCTVQTGFDKQVEDNKTVKVTRYTLLFDFPGDEIMGYEAQSDMKATIDVFEEGAYKGKVMSFEFGMEDYEPGTRYTFWYDEKAEYDGQYMDPLSYTMCYQSGTISANVPKHSMTINYTGKNPAIKSWTIESDGNVRFFFPIDSFKPDHKSYYNTGFSYTDNGTVNTIPACYFNEKGEYDFDKLNALAEIINVEDKNGNYTVNADYVNAFSWDDSQCDYVDTGFTLAGTDSLAASYGDSLDLSKQQIQLNGTTNFTFTGDFYHRSKKINGKVQGLFPKATEVKIDFTVTCSVEEDPDNKDNYKATIEYKGYTPKDQKIKMKKITAISKNVIGNTLMPCPYITCFDYETGENLEYTGGNENYKVIIRTEKEDATYYPDQKFSYRLKKSGKYNKKAVYKNLKSSDAVYTISYPKTCKNVCYGVGLISLKGKDFSLDNDGWFDGKIAKFGDSIFYKDTIDNSAYIRLPGDD